MRSGLSTIVNKKRKKILFVDDEPDMTSLFKMALERAGFHVDTFNDPAIAAQHFRPDSYSLVLLDIIMTKMNGFELYRQIKKVDPNVTICFLTASEKYREELKKEEYCTLDMGLFIQKPISIKDLVREVNKRISLSDQ